jgi:hypothetical protein
MFLMIIWFVNFSSMAGSLGGENAETMPNESLIMSVGEIWSEIDQLDEVDPWSASVSPAINQNDQALHSCVGSSKVEVDYGDSLVVKDIPSSSTCLPQSYEEGSMRNKAARILANAARAVSP